jgi:hypothetical protein
MHGDNAQARDARRTQLIWTLLLTLLAVGVWRPPEAYPMPGILFTCGLALCTAVAAATSGASAQSRPATPARMARLAAVAIWVYVYLRWLIAGLPAVGMESVTTLTLGALSATAAFFVMSRPTDRDNHYRLLLRVVVAGTIACAIHAVAQYLFLYDRAYQALKSALEGQRPSALDMAMLHHLKLKRVASVWGDPNVFGAFLGMSVAPSLALLRIPRTDGRGWAKPDTLAAVAGLIAAATGIVLSGSRGGLLTALVCAILMGRPRRLEGGASMPIVAGVALLMFAIARPMTAETTDTASRFEPRPVQPTGIAGMLARSDTIRERVHYARIGVGILAAHPVFGAGPGGVDLLYGRFKPPTANESKYLHNWILQTGAEWGTVGIVLMIVFVLALMAAGVETARTGIAGRAIAVMAAGFLVDGLYSLSFHDTGLMMLFGLTAGTLLAGHDRHPAAPARTWSCQKIAWCAALALVAVGHVIPALAAKACRDAADAAIEEGNTVRATALFRRATSLTPRDPRPMLGLAALAELGGNPGQALLFARRALQIQPASASIHATVARLELIVGHAAEAEAAIQRAIELYPNNPAYHDQHARILHARGNRPGAVAAARRAVQLGGLDKDRHEAFLRELEGGPPR